MERVFLVVVFHYFVFTNICSVVLCESKSLKFVGKQAFEDKTCPVGDIVFNEMALSEIDCAYKCFGNPGCLGVSFSPQDLACTGCSNLYTTDTHLDDKQDSVFFALYIECGEPVVPDSHVQLDTFDGNSQTGANMSYNCTPCTYFPQTEPALITCQENGTWSTPTCVYGPSVGKLPNGQLIPEGAIGCVSTFESTCPLEEVKNGSALLYNGETGSCFCDKMCCGSDDCCFDSTCDDSDYDDKYDYYDSN